MRPDASVTCRRASAVLPVMGRWRRPQASAGALFDFCSLPDSGPRVIRPPGAAGTPSVTGPDVRDRSRTGGHRGCPVGRLDRRRRRRAGGASTRPGSPGDAWVPECLWVPDAGLLSGDSGRSVHGLSMSLRGSWRPDGAPYRDQNLSREGGVGDITTATWTTHVHGERTMAPATIDGIRAALSAEQHGAFDAQIGATPDDELHLVLTGWALSTTEDQNVLLRAGAAPRPGVDPGAPVPARRSRLLPPVSGRWRRVPAPPGPAQPGKAVRPRRWSRYPARSRCGGS